jgi:hypothetical protein
MTTNQAFDIDTTLIGIEVEGFESAVLAHKLKGVKFLVSTKVPCTRVDLLILV